MKCGSENNSYQKESISVKVKLVTCGKSNITVVGEDENIYVFGYSKLGHLGPNTNYDKYTKI